MILAEAIRLEEEKRSGGKFPDEICSNCAFCRKMEEPEEDETHECRNSESEQYEWPISEEEKACDCFLQTWVKD